jgi:hypothetical protein
MPSVRVLAFFVALSTCTYAAVPCAPVAGRNGSALCISLTVTKGQIAASEFAFAPTAAYQADSGLPFFQMAQKEIAGLPKPCQPLLAQGTKPAPPFCSQDAKWPDFTQAYLAHAETLERTDLAINLLSEAGLFRSLAIAYHHAPLLLSSVNAEAGIVVFQIPDPLDPRTAGTFQIELRGTADDDTRNRRIVKLRQTLAPLRNQVFCHDRIRARVEAFYKTLRIPIDIVQLDPQGPLLIVQEKP